MSRFIVALVRESLDLGEIAGSYARSLGQPPFDPRMMTALLLNGYASGMAMRAGSIPRAGSPRRAPSAPTSWMIAALDNPAQTAIWTGS